MKLTGFRAGTSYQEEGACTVWLRQEQIGALFGRERSVITKHLRNIVKEQEEGVQSHLNLNRYGYILLMTVKPIR